MVKLSHKQSHAQWKKERRRKIRQIAAKLRDEADRANSDIDEELSDAREALLLDMEEKERERLNNEWLAREAAAMAKFEQQAKLKEGVQVNAQLTSRFQEEWEQQMKSDKDQSVLNKDDNSKNIEDRRPSTPEFSEVNRPLHNPSPPENFGTELDQQNCPFFLKTGACRFGDRCSRGHPKPSVSCTILIPGMFSHFSINKALRDEYDSDMILEYEDSEFYQHFKDFYEDTLPEFKAVGHVVQFKVCCNFEPHLRGNVYVQYDREEEAIRALNFFNGRWYAGRQLSCEFSLVSKWKSAICGLYHRNKCPKGRTCNFLHVFKNPNNEFWAADFYRSPSEMGDTRTPCKDTLSQRNSSRRSTQHSTTRRESKDKIKRETKFVRDKSHSRSSSRHSSKSSKRRSSKRSSHSSQLRAKSPSSSSELAITDKSSIIKQSPPNKRRHKKPRIK